MIVPPIQKVSWRSDEFLTLRDQIRWSDNRRVETNEQHARIYLALTAGDVARAQSEMRDHIRAACNSLLDEMRQPPAMNGGK